MKLEVLNPRAVITPDYHGLSAERPADLNGKTVGILGEKDDGIIFLGAMKELLRTQFPNVKFIDYVSPSGPIGDRNVVNKVAAECDAWLEGIKTSGSGMFDTGASMERLGCPGVTFSVDGLIPQRKRLAEVNGYPILRIVPVPGATLFACENSPVKLAEIAQSCYEATVAALTSPLTDSERNPAPFAFDYGNITFDGGDAYEQFQQYAIANDMGDGLPLTPPTPERVAEMLKGTKLSPDEVIGTMVPRFGKATVEKIAINAVMAGAKPEYLPVIIAGVEAMCDPSFNLYHIDTGTLGSSIVMWVNGPIAKQIGLNSGIGFVGPGNRANSTIGRSLSLCMVNIGWAFYNTEVSMQGNPARYTNLVFAENEAESPWESFAEEWGFSPNDSTVTLDECIWTERLGPSGCMVCSPIEQDLENLANMCKGYMPGFMPARKFGDAAQFMSFGSLADQINHMYAEIAVYPAMAHTFANAGYTKAKMQMAIADKFRVPWDDCSDAQQSELLELAKAGTIPGLTIDDCKSGGMVPTYNAKHIALIVTGDNVGQCLSFCGGGAAVINSDMGDAPQYDFITKKVRI